MASPVKGIGVIFKLKKGDNYVDIACATSLDFHGESEMIRKTGPNSGGYREYRPRLFDWGFTLNAVTTVKNDIGFTTFDMLDETLRREGLDIEAVYGDEDGNEVVLRGHVYIPSVDISSPVVGFSENTIEFLGSGLLQKDTTVLPPITGEEVKKYEYVADGTHYALTDPILINREILEFSRDGVGLQVITAGTQNDKQVKYIPGMGQFNFSTPLESGEYVLILYK